MRRQAGDTIVEVMLAIVVISTVLAGAFVVSRSSLKHVRDSEEHSQALKLVQGQIELLRAAAIKVPNGSSFPASFCMAPNATVTTNPATCTTSFYTLSIKSIDPAHGTYQATAKWSNVSGNPAQVQLSYRVAFASP